MSVNRREDGAGDLEDDDAFVDAHEDSIVSVEIIEPPSPTMREVS
jgi:hypothetical protein